MNVKCLIALGANQGDCENAVRAAMQTLGAHPSARLIQTSPLHRTAPVGGPTGQGDFVNAAALLETRMSASQLLSWLLHIERDMGRQRTQRWGSRVIDLDLLLFGDQVVAAGDIEVPHPRMTFRRFVLEPAAQVAGEMKHPLTGWSVQELLDHLNQTPRLLAIVACDPVQSALATEWARKISRKFAAACLLKNELDDARQAIDNLRSSSSGMVGDFIIESDSANYDARLVVQLTSDSSDVADVDGPVLRLSAHDPTLEDEISAAFEAMH